MTQSTTKHLASTRISERIVIKKQFACTVIRFVIYTVILIASLSSLPLIAEYAGAATFKEGGPVESAQLALVLFSAGILATGAWRSPAWRGLLCLLAFLASIAAVRELDSVLDRLIPVLGWKAPAGVLVFFAAFCAWHYRKGLIWQIQGFITSYPFSILWAGLLIVVVCAQSVGNGRMLEALMLSDYVRDYKRMVEELIELCGYFFIAVGSIEMVIRTLTCLPQLETTVQK
jgi:hypothetical protein